MVVGISTRAAPQDEREVILAVRGMTCGSCAARLEERLDELDGVAASVNYATQRALVRTTLPTEALLSAVHAAGYSATEVRSDARGQTADTLRAEADQRARTLGSRLVVAGLLFMPLCDASIAFSIQPAFRFPGWQWLLLVLALPVVTWCAWPIYVVAARQICHGVTSMDTLSSLGILTATGWSLYAMFTLDGQTKPGSIADVIVHPGGGALYLDVAAGVTTFLLAGRYFEARSRRRATDSLGSLAAIAARHVTLQNADGSERLCPATDLLVGDLFVVRPGETLAADGVVVDGWAVLDRSSMTGESIPTEVTTGDAVIGGTTATGGRLVVRAEAVGDATQLAQMVQLVERAQHQKAATQRLADRIAAVFVPVVLALSACTLAAWILAGAGAERAVSASLSVLIIACPCALGLATPMAFLMASDRGARSGIFFKGYQAIEMSGHIDTVLLDKTGTVTSARMSVAGVAATAGWSEHDVLQLAAVIERASEHPIGRAIAACVAEERGLEAAEDFRAEEGRGVRARIRGRVVAVDAVDRAGQLPEDVAAQVQLWQTQGRTVVAVSRDDRVVGAVAVADTVRPSAPAAIEILHDLDLRCALLTGDNEATARAVATRCGIEEWMAGVSPHDKAAVVARLQQEGHRVAMVGDGVNDAPALARADLALAVGSGTDVARNSADLLILRDDLRVVPTAIALARSTERTIRQNLTWAFGYNVAAIPLAACGLLNPLIAAAAMALSSGFVVWNSSRLRSFRDPRRVSEVEGGPIR